MTKTVINLIGKNLVNSKSVFIHNALYKFFGLNLIYQNLEIQTQKELFACLSTSNKETPVIANVTYPYKSAVLDFVLNNKGKIDDSSKYAGGCNLVFSSSMKCFNFDGLGFVKFLQIENIDFNLKNILICGNGVTAISIAFALMQEFSCNVEIATRNLNVTTKDNVRAISYSDASKKLDKFDIIINTVPAKFENEITDYLKDVSNQIIFDINYGQNLEIQKLADSSHTKFFDGSGMLAAQAILSDEQIFRELNIYNKNTFDFEKLYNIALTEIQG